MSNSKTQAILEKVYNDHARNILNWALRRLKSKEEAEDFCHEVMARFCQKLITKEAKGEEIREVNRYLWQIAYTTMDQYYIKQSKEEKLVNDLLSDIDIQNTQEKPPDTEKLLEKLWKSISQLEYNLREAMIMHYLQQKSLAEIGKILNVTESYVKKLIYQGRSKIRENDRNHQYDTEKVYHPNSLMMAFSGEEQIYPDFAKIADSLTKQNICLECYEKACSIQDLSHQLGLPCAYIEFDIKWLLERGFIAKQKNKYSTTFFIFDGTFNTRLLNTYIKHKVKCTDKIIGKLTDLQDRIKAIGFIGCEMPIKRLLWLLIYTFTDIASTQTGNRFELLHRSDGGLYYPIGIFNIDSKLPIAPQFTPKYDGMKKWECSGTYTFDDGDNNINWLGVSKAAVDLQTNLSIGSPMLDVLDYKEILYMVVKPNFKIDNVTDAERYTISQCINKGFLSISDKDGSVSPNFCVFTITQRQELDNILLECYNEMKPRLTKLYADIRKMCRDYLPKQLDNYLDFISYFCLKYSHFFTTGFAFYDEKLFIPEDTTDYTMLTLSMTVADKPEENKHNHSYRLIINHRR